MLELKNITKIYNTNASARVKALSDVSIAFRKNEFVSILGPSGCGKTTMLNIIGGLDRYTSGELYVDGKPTSAFSDSDYDNYRNKKIGFVFQNYNLISHQTVLENVELALSLSGVNKKQKKHRAMLALEKVGLENHLHKKPSELSGGEMQRVAIARAIVNNPEIILADEPTGALDSKTSVQIMDILKKISSDRLVIMVTHNDALANTYSTRIIRLFDSKVISDSNPYIAQTKKENALTEQKAKINKSGEARKQSKQTNAEQDKKSSMSFKTALTLSFKNLLTKKARTVLTSLACSIGIIGLALVLALFNGLNVFLNKVQYDTLSAYPMYVSTSTTTDAAEYISIITDSSNYLSDPSMKDKIYVSHLITKLKETTVKNTITKDYVTYVKNAPQEYLRDVVYNYGTPMNVYKKTVAFDSSTYDFLPTSMLVDYAKVSVGSYFKQLVGNKDFVLSQYDLVAGKYPEEKDELVLVLDKNNRISDVMLVAFLMDINATQKDENGDFTVNSYDYDKFLGEKNADGTRKESLYGSFTLALNDGLYTYDQENDYYKRNEQSLEQQMKAKYTNMGFEAIIDRLLSELKQTGLSLPDCYCGKKSQTLDLKIVGILRLNDDTTTGCMSAYPIGYTAELTEYILEQAANSQVVKAQLKEYNSLTSDTALCRDITLSDGTINDKGEDISKINKAAAKTKLTKLGYAETPVKIEFYASDFENKVSLKKYLAAYNEKADVEEEERIYVTDAVSSVIDVLKTFIDTITCILLALTAISLVVAAIMIAIITYVSVIERTREIGILRSIGARKIDVMGVFNAETIIIGMASGILGILLALIIQIPLNAGLLAYTGISSLAALSPLHAFLLIIVSIAVTLISGMIPAMIASKKDPVKALRAD